MGERIADLVGSYADTDALNQWLTEGARVVIHALPPQLLWLVATDVTDAGSGVTVTTGRVLYAHKSGRYAIRVAPEAKTVLSDSNSIWAASDFAPAFYLEKGKAYVLGDSAGGTVGVVSYPTVATTDTTITGFPDEVDHLLPLFAGARVQTARAFAIATPTQDAAATAPTAPTLGSTTLTFPTYAPPPLWTLPALPDDVTLTLPSAPAAYSAPSVTLPTPPTLSALSLAGITVPTAPTAASLLAVDATPGSISATTIGALPTLPTYTAPTFGGTLTIPALPTLTYATKIDGTTAFTLPSAPSAPAVSYSDATLGTWAAAATIGSLPAPPTLTEATFGGDVASITSAIPAVLDLTTELDGTTALDPPVPPNDPVLASVGLTPTSVGSLGTAPTYTPTATTIDFTNYTTYEGDEDPEMMRGIIEKLLAELKDLDSTRQDEYNEFQKELEVYRSTVQAAIQNAQITLQEQIATLQQADQMALQDYAQELSLYDRELAKYTAETERQVMQVRANLERAISGLAEAQRLWVQLYQTNAQEKIAAFQGALQDHMRECDAILQQAQFDQQHLSETYRTTADVNVQNEIQTAQVALANYAQEMARYRALLEQYQLDVALVSQKWELDFRKAVEPWAQEQQMQLQLYAQDIQNEATSFGGAMQDHLREIDRLIEQARLDQARLTEVARLTTEANLRNEAETLRGEISEEELKLQRYASEIAQYRAEVEAAIQTYLADSVQRQIVYWQEQGAQALRKYAADIESETTLAQTAIASYQAQVQAKIGEYESLTGRDLTAYRVEMEALTAAFRADLEASASDFQAEIQKGQLEIEETLRNNEAKVAKYQQEIVGYTAETQESVGRFQMAIQHFAATKQALLLDAERLTALFDRELGFYTGAQA